MSLLSYFRSLGSGIFHRSRADQEMEDELRSHIRNRADDLLRSGLTRDDAERQARIEFGGLERFKEEARESMGAHFFETLVQDVRFGLRMLRKSPGFTMVAVLTLALGIGANTAIFSLLDSLVWRDLPVPHPEELVRFTAHSPADSSGGLSLPMFQEIARSQKIFSGVFAWWGEGVLTVETGNELARLDVWAVDGNYYRELGATPAAGRLIGPSDVDLNNPSSAPVAVLGYNYWQSRFGGNPDAIGQTLRVEGVPFTIIGVTGKGFSGVTADLDPQITIPLTAEPAVNGSKDVLKSLARKSALWVGAAGRLKPGVTLQQAEAELNVLWPAVREQMISGDDTPDRRHFVQILQLRVESAAKGSSFARGWFLRPLYVLLGLAGLVLLIACVNLASLTVARSASREKEMGVRAALGARRGRLARQMFTEILLLATAGALCGFGLAQWASRMLSNFILGQLYVVPAHLNLQPDARVLAFTTAAVMVTGMIFGLMPARRASNESPMTALHQGARTGDRHSAAAGRRLVTSQVALSLVLLACAGLFVRSLEALRSVQPGYRTRGLLRAELAPLPGGYNNLDLVSYYQALTSHVGSLPEVQSAAISHLHPASIGEWTERVRIRGAAEQGAQADLDLVMPGFFSVMEIPLVQGRDFTWLDREHSRHVVIVSHNFAAQWFPHGDAIGQHIDISDSPEWSDLEIVGIVGNVTFYDIRKHQPPTIYLPAMQYGDYMEDSELMVVPKAGYAATASALQRAVRSLGHEYVGSIATVTADIDRSLLQERVVAMLAMFFGGLALLLAIIGLYGLMSYTVARRKREIGIRMALGAQRTQVLRMLIRETLALVLAGVFIGVPIALGAARLIVHMLFGVSTAVPLTLVAVSMIMLAASLVAGYLPARRAMKVDPMVALRYE